MAWGSDTAATQLTGITTEQFFNQVPTLNPRETAHHGANACGLMLRERTIRTIFSVPASRRPTAFDR
jgi:hypothetical protein